MELDLETVKRWNEDICKNSLTERQVRRLARAISNWAEAAMESGIQIGIDLAKDGGGPSDTPRTERPIVQEPDIDPLRPQ